MMTDRSPNSLNLSHPSHSWLVSFSAEHSLLDQRIVLFATVGVGAAERAGSYRMAMPYRGLNETD
jgi:hypothetical protein